MTLGQRIQELRKQRGMSQESLGEALGVSRQAVSKWEGDNSIPELDSLIAMSRLFEITVGQLLGIEDPAEQENETVNETDEDKVESVLRRYVEQTTDKRSGLARWGWFASAAVAVVIVFVVMFSQMGSLRNTVKLLQSDLSNLQVNVSNSQSNLYGQIRNTIYEVLEEEAKLLSTFKWELVDFDLDNQTATLSLSATMKEYAAGSRMQFGAAWQKVDDTEGQTTGDWTDGPNFSSEITLPLNCNTVISIRVEDVEGNIKEQVLQEPIYELHPDNFRLTAYNLTVPFAVTVKGFGASVSTAKAEQAYIEIVSMFPEFFWPEEAVLTAYVNDVEVMSETMTVTPSKRQEQVFNASIRDIYYDVTLKEGDRLETVLTVTDNLGRCARFDECIGVENGELDRAPIAVATDY